DESLALCLAGSTEGTWIRTAADGSFAWPRVAAGRYRIETLHDAQPRRLGPDFEVRGDVDFGDLVAAPLATLRWRLVQADGAPWPGPMPTFLLTSADVASEWVRRLPDEGSGTTTVGAGRWRLSLDRDSAPGLAAADVVVDVRAGATVDVALELASGRTVTFVVRRPDGAPRRPRERLTLAAVAADGTSAFDRTLDLLAHDDWRLGVALPDGTYTLVGRTATGAQLRASWTVGPGSPATCELQLQ
ncbi:MAG: hypothetical protein JNK15_02075, partial [Planctomycetes bacterium]|nr:hypothetical protein [Planctomycetota bacterium]